MCTRLQVLTRLSVTRAPPMESTSYLWFLKELPYTHHFLVRASNEPKINKDNKPLKSRHWNRPPVIMMHELLLLLLHWNDEHFLTNSQLLKLPKPNLTQHTLFILKSTSGSSVSRHRWLRSMRVSWCGAECPRSDQTALRRRDTEEPAALRLHLLVLRPDPLLTLHHG